MVELLAGKNSFALHARAKSIQDAWLKDHGDESIVYMDGSEVEWEELNQALGGVSLFAPEATLVVLSDATAQKHIADKLLELIEQKIGSNEDLDLLLLDPGIDKRSALYKLLNKNDMVELFEPLDEYALAKWAGEFAKQHGASLEGKLAGGLVERVGIDQQRIATEIEKLASGNKTITVELIEDLVEPGIDASIFNLLDEVFSGKGEESIRLYRDLRTDGVEPIYASTMLAWQANNMAVALASGSAPENETSKAFGVSPFALRKAKGLVRGMNKQQMKELLQELMNLDKALKSSSTDADAIMETTLLRLAASR